ncbi:MAG: hypothetical protein ABFC34_10315 [Methanobacterium sp.]
MMKKKTSKKNYNKPQLETHGDLEKITKYHDPGGGDDDGGTIS